MVDLTDFETRGTTVYVEGNPKTKKLLRKWVEEGDPKVFSPGPFPCPQNGVVAVEGPHYPAAHTWYARVQVVNGAITKVLS